MARVKKSTNKDIIYNSNYNTINHYIEYYILYGHLYLQNTNLNIHQKKIEFKKR